MGKKNRRGGNSLFFAEKKKASLSPTPHSFRHSAASQPCCYFLASHCRPLPPTSRHQQRTRRSSRGIQRHGDRVRDSLVSALTSSSRLVVLPSSCSMKCRGFVAELSIAPRVLWFGSPWKDNLSWQYITMLQWIDPLHSQGPMAPIK